MILAVGVPLALVAALLPPALLAGKFTALYDSIPQEVKVRYKLTSEVPPKSGGDWIWPFLTVILVWPSEWLRPFQISITVILLLLVGWSLIPKMQLFLRLARAKNDVPKSLVSFSRYCVVGLFIAAGFSLFILFILFASLIKTY